MSLRKQVKCPCTKPGLDDVFTPHQFTCEECGSKWYWTPSFLYKGRPERKKVGRFRTEIVFRPHVIEGYWFCFEPKKQWKEIG